ncbi:MAG: Gfo/Idh/MocA family oxidoreductase [Rhizobiaceae bacterium]
MKPVTIAIVGTGFVADYYMTTLARHPQLKLAGAYDIDPGRLAEFCAFHNITAYPDYNAILADLSVSIIVNLTSAQAHYAVSMAAFAAGKHVYSEKPLAMQLADAQDLIELARSKGLTLASAPANGLSDAYQLVAEKLAADAIGTPRLVYAEMEDGPVFRENWQGWKSRSGAPWPGVHEFEVGCTLEHAGYALSWLVGLFGPADTVTAFSSLAFPQKGEASEGHALAPDFSVGCLTFKSGVVARLTSGLAAPRDRSLTILGDKGSITVRDLWDNQSVVHLEEAGQPRPFMQKVLRRVEAWLGKALPFKLVPGKRLAYPKRGKANLPAYPSKIDFMAGIAAQADMINGSEPAFYSDAVSLHITELALALHNAKDLPQPYKLNSAF